MQQPRIILDKSVVEGLNLNLEVIALDRYFFQIIPSILVNEILGDLSKRSKNKSRDENIPPSNSYKISGNRGLTTNYQHILVNSLTGKQEVLMEGKFYPASERLVRLRDGSVGTKIETPIEDETIARWERKEFTIVEKVWAEKWRKKTRNIYPKMYIDKINDVGIQFKTPRDIKELVAFVDSLLQERKFQRMLLFFLYRENDIPRELHKQINVRWSTNGRPLIKDFAPYAFFCVRANLLLAIGLTNPQIFKPHKHNKRDLEYCYYLPHCEIFSSNDPLQKKLVPLLLREDQSFVDGDELKKDLRKLSEEWNNLSKEEKMRVHSERDFNPPLNENSIISKLWQKHRKDYTMPFNKSILKATGVDCNKPLNEQISMTFGEFISMKYKEQEDSEDMSEKEINELREINGENNPVLFRSRETLISKERLSNMFPHLKISDLH